MSLENYFAKKNGSDKPPTKKRRLNESKKVEIVPEIEIPIQNEEKEPEKPFHTLTETEKKEREEENRKRAQKIRQQKAQEKKLETILGPLTEPGWKELLRVQSKRPYFSKLLSFVESEQQSGKAIYPPPNLTFNAFNSSPVENVSVVILGQDPYHGAKQAMGMSFSVQTGIRIPPSLKNIYKELESDTGVSFKSPKHGNLQEWANQGVFLLNTVLTVRAASPNSHQNQGWEDFTNSVISEIDRKCDHVVFMLWGSKARAKSSLINKKKHLILTCAHPSPYSAANGFFGCKHFSKANNWLKEHGKTPITWGLSETPPSPPTTTRPTIQSMQPLVGLKRKREVDTAIESSVVKQIPKEIPKGPWKWELASIECVLGDMVAQRLDIIVNPANKHMRHAGGLARAIEVAGGDSVRLESKEWIKQNGVLDVGKVAQTTGGQLPCKILFHVVGPFWKNGKSGEEDDLSLVVNNCLKEADEVGVESIALPAISTGLYKYPVEQCADVMLRATKKYLQLHPKDSSLRVIRYVLFDEETFNAFSIAAARACHVSAHSWSITEELFKKIKKL